MDYSGLYDPDTDFDRWYTVAAADVITPLVRPTDRVLELGCATGAMTARLCGTGASVVAVEKSAAYLERARGRRLRGVEYVQAELEGWRPDGAQRFHHVVATNVLHEVADPLRLMALAHEVLAPGGLVHVTLQNPSSVHRQLGLRMGLAADLEELSDLGRTLGSHGLFSVARVESMARQVGLSCVFRRGLVYKPLPNALMAGLPEELIRAFVAMAVDHPDTSAMNYFALVAA